RSLAREGCVRAVVVVEGLPFGQPLPQVHVVGVAQELVELLLIGAVRAVATTSRLLVSATLGREWDGNRRRAVPATPLRAPNQLDSLMLGPGLEPGRPLQRSAEPSGDRPGTPGGPIIRCVVTERRRVLDTTGEWLGGAKGEYPIHRPFYEAAAPVNV